MRLGDNSPRVSAIVGVLTVALALAALLVPLPRTASAAATHEITMSARMFAYEPGRVRVGQGDRVTITLESTDVVHGLYVDGYNVDIRAEPGQPATVTFVADKLGKFKFRCSVSCGAMHPFMIGELVVGPNLPFGRGAAALLIVTLGSLFALSLRP